MREEYSAFIVRSSEGRRESVAPEDWEAYEQQRQAILKWLRAREDK